MSILIRNLIGKLITTSYIKFIAHNFDFVKLYIHIAKKQEQNTLFDIKYNKKLI